MMTIRDRILAVYRGQRPDVVPVMLDLSHWFYHRQRMPWDLGAAYEQPECALVDYHKRSGVGFYMPNLAAFYSTVCSADTCATAARRTWQGHPEIVWTIETPLGAIHRARAWSEQTYSWGITRWGIQSEHDLRVFQYAMSRRSFRPHWDRYQQWADYVGECGVVYMPLGYSAMGHLLHYWMGVERVVFATVDMTELLRETIEAVNANTLELVDLVCESPAEVIVMGDNFSSDVQPPRFFAAWSASFYREAIRRIHQAGKFAAVHIDGRLKGALRMIRDVGADCADAVTPAPMGDLSAAECRREAGDELILSGGVPPDLWLPESPLEAFRTAVLAWLAQKGKVCRLIAGAGDQVPPGAAEERIGLIRSLVEEFGRVE